TASSGGTTTTAASSGGSGGTITVGELDAITGPKSEVGSWLLHGVKVGVHAVNQAGGVMGKKLTITASDTAGDSVDAVPALRKLLLKQPDFVVGPFSYVITTVIKDFGPAHTVDFTVGGTTTIDHMMQPYVFRVTPSDSTMAAGMAAYAIHKGYKNCAMVFDTSAAAQSLVPYVKAAYTGNGGHLAIELNIAPSQTSYRSEVVKLKAAKPDCIFMQTGDPTGVTFFANMKQLGALDVPVVSTDTGTQVKFAQAMGWKYAEKYLSGMNGAPPKGTAYQTFVKNTSAVYHAPPVNLSQNMYDAVIIASLAMTAAHSTDPKVWVNKVVDVSNTPGTKCDSYPACAKLLKAGTKINYEGATGPQDFNKYHNVFGPWSVVRFNSSHKLYQIGSVSGATQAKFSKAFAHIK
ncbi:MAG: ABC transporter substrate-binding protein, partial [Acidimicrobiales bacterium]